MSTFGRTSTIATIIGSGILLGACVAPADETAQARQDLVIDPLVFDTAAALEQPLKVEVEVDVEVPRKGRRGKAKEEGKKEKGEDSAKRDSEAEEEGAQEDEETQKDEGEEREKPGTRASSLVVDAQCCVDGVCRWGPCDAPGYAPGYYAPGYGYGRPYDAYGYDPYYGAGYPYYGAGREVVSRTTIVDERGFACDPYGGCVRVY